MKAAERRVVGGVSAYVHPGSRFPEKRGGKPGCWPRVIHTGTELPLRLSFRALLVNKVPLDLLVPLVPA